MVTPLSAIPDFDPARMPVLGTDAHLPAVPFARLTSAALQERFADPPMWSPEIAGEARFSDRPATAAAVLVPLVMHEQPRVLLTRRTAHMSSHPGQVAFPGGKTDLSDADASATALREAHEEVGLDAVFVQVLGKLPIYVTGSAFLITPVVALVQPGFSWRANPFEVAEVFEVPLHFLMDPANHRRHAIEWEGQRREWFSMLYREAGAEHLIWGATAGMLRNFYRFLSA
jgi:8-oxo-dGTP pyrophosphatase MutT (NUDIX family)